MCGESTSRYDEDVFLWCCIRKTFFFGVLSSRLSTLFVLMGARGRTTPEQGQGHSSMKKPKQTLALFYCQNTPESGEKDRQALEEEYGGRLKLFPLPCGGRLEPLHLLRALEEFADAVYVITCPEGACRYFEGNLRARKRAESGSSFRIRDRAGKGEGGDRGQQQGSPQVPRRTNRRNHGKDQTPQRLTCSQHSQRKRKKRGEPS